MLNINFTFLIQWANFLAIMAIIHFFLLKPVLDFVAQRKRRIMGDLEEARKKGQSVREIMATIEQKLSLLHREVNEDINRTRLELLELSREKLDKARNDALSMVEDAQRSIRKEVDQVKAQLWQEKEELAQMVAEKVLGRKLRANKNKRN